MQKYFNFNSSVKNNLIFCYVMNFRHSIWWIHDDEGDSSLGEGVKPPQPYKLGSKALL